MASYKYLFERPTIEVDAAEQWMDFDAIVSKATWWKRFRLIRNATFLAAFVGASVVGTLYMNQPENDKEKVTDSVGPVMADSMPLAVEEQSDRPRLIPPSGVKTPQAESSRREVSSSQSQATSEDTHSGEKDGGADFKIGEASPAESVFAQATPKDGFERLFEYFNENTEYPENLKSERIEGRVVVEFVVQQSGEIAGIAVIHTLHPVLDSLAMMAVKNMPAWNPATVNGKPVDTRHSIPLMFQMENDRELDHKEVESGEEVNQPAR